MMPTTRHASPLEGNASAAIQEALARLQPTGRTPTFPRDTSPMKGLTQQDIDEVDGIVKSGTLCHFCAGIHSLPSTHACPRVASVSFSPDGKTVTAVSYWPDGEWDTNRVAFPEDVLQESTDDDDDNTGQEQV